MAGLTKDLNPIYVVNSTDISLVPSNGGLVDMEEKCLEGEDIRLMIDNNPVHFGLSHIT